MWLRFIVYISTLALIGTFVIMYIVSVSTKQKCEDYLKIETE